MRTQSTHSAEWHTRLRCVRNGRPGIVAIDRFIPSPNRIVSRVPMRSPLNGDNPYKPDNSYSYSSSYSMKWYSYSYSIRTGSIRTGSIRTGHRVRVPPAAEYEYEYENASWRWTECLVRNSWRIPLRLNLVPFRVKRLVLTKVANRVRVFQESRRTGR